MTVTAHLQHMQILIGRAIHSTCTHFFLKGPEPLEMECYFPSLNSYSDCLVTVSHCINTWLATVQFDYKHMVTHVKSVFLNTRLATVQFDHKHTVIHVKSVFLLAYMAAQKKNQDTKEENHNHSQKKITL